MRFLITLIVSISLLCTPVYVEAESTPEIVLEGKLSSNYGRRLHPISKIYKIHHGIDLKLQNPIVYTPVDGVIKSAKWERGYGNTVRIILDNGDEIMFAHLKSFSVKPKQIVESGESIGIVGSTGHTTGIHLHVEYRINNQRINPLNVIELK